MRQILALGPEITEERFNKSVWGTLDCNQLFHPNKNNSFYQIKQLLTLWAQCRDYLVSLLEKSLLYKVFEQLVKLTMMWLAQNWRWDMQSFKEANTLPTNRLFTCMAISVKMSCRGSMRKIVLFEALHMPGLLKSLCSSLQKKISRCFHCFCMIYLSINVFVPPPVDWLRQEIFIREKVNEFPGNNFLHSITMVMTHSAATQCSYYPLWWNICQ